MERTTDLQMDKRGRLTIPNTVRKQLGVENESADVRVTLEVLKVHE